MACACPATNTFAGANRPTPALVGSDGVHVGGTVKFPSAFDSRKTYPLLVVLHGRTDDGTTILTELAMTEVHNMDSGVIVWSPTAATDPNGPATAWNTPSCCWTGADPQDDVAYIHAGITTIRGLYPIDDSRIWGFGHSNGAFMLQHYVQSHADTMVGFIALNGYVSLDPFSLSEPVHVHVIGSTADTAVLFAGDPVGGAAVPQGPHLGAVDTADAWHAANGGVSSLAAAGAAFDIDSNVVGSESATQVYTAQAPGGNGNVSLTTMTLSTHLPQFTTSTRVAARDFFHGILRGMVRT